MQVAVILLEPYFYMRGRVHQRYLKDVFQNGISALGYFWVWGKIELYLRVKSLPGANSKPPSGPVLDPTGGRVRSAPACPLHDIVITKIVW